MQKGNHPASPSKQSAGLYLVPTPIGNLRDITLRALDILSGVDVIACEDTRVTAKLLDAYGIDTPTTAYHDHNAARVRPRLLQRIAGGGAVALVSDAGTPLVSDPGYKLVRAAIDDGHAVTALPGASAVMTGLLSAGLPTDMFMFAGFPPPKTIARKKFLSRLTEIPASLVFFESARRLGDCLADMAAAFGPRNAAVARELTKKFEETRRGTLEELSAHYTGKAAPKGEIVILIAPPAADRPATDEEIDAALLGAFEGNSTKTAVDLVTAKLGVPRRTVYQRALALKNDAGAA